MLDAPTTAGTTIAEQFLTKRAKTLAPEERDYLQQLAATRMGLYRIEKVHRDRGLTCVDLWTNERIELREPKLTECVKPTWVIGARAFPAIDGATELDGAIYALGEAQAYTVVRSLRTEWIAARAVFDEGRGQRRHRRCKALPMGFLLPRLGYVNREFDRSKYALPVR